MTGSQPHSVPNWWHETRGPSPVTYASDLGEIRRVALADGSRLVLDTATTVTVTLGKNARRVVLVAGRAHIDVAHDPSRPLSVKAGEREVVAKGTGFDVEVDQGGVTVFLDHGLVDVIDGSGNRTSLVPGQRLRSRKGIVRVDEPDATSKTAWQGGRLVFDGNTVAEAIAAMNRYDHRKIVVPDSAVGALKISGAYATGDTRAFARSVSDLLDIGLEERADVIILTRKSPASPPPRRT